MLNQHNGGSSANKCFRESCCPHFLWSLPTGLAFQPGPASAGRPAPCRRDGDASPAAVVRGRGGGGQGSLPRQWKADLRSRRPPWAEPSDIATLKLRVLVRSLCGCSWLAQTYQCQRGVKNRVGLRDSGHCSGEQCRRKSQMVWVLIRVLPVHRWAI